MKLTTTDFENGKAIPAEHTCDGTDLSPALEWSGAPAGTRSFALVCEDPDAPGGTWVHWVIYGLANTTTGLSGGVSTAATLPDGSRQGLNDFGRVGYGGPCPPRGGPHRYVFKLYALDAEPSLKSRATKAELLHAMQGHILAETQLMGTYQRAR